MKEPIYSFNDGKVLLHVTCPYCGAKLYRWVKVTQYSNPIVVRCEDEGVTICGRSFGILPNFSVSLEIFSIEPIKMQTCA